MQHNPGAAFSFLHDAGGWQRWLFTGIAVVVSVFIAVWMARLPQVQRLLLGGLTLILGGAVGNLIDRVRFGYVVDFLSAHYQDHYFMAFNVADSAITVGAGLLLLDMVLNPHHHSDKKKAENQRGYAMSALAIGPGTRVTLHFALKLANGDVVDSTFDRAPASFTVGDGNLLAGFERKLSGLHKGDEQVFEVKPEDAFGQPNPANVQRFSRAAFDGLELHEGLVVSFADAAKTELPGVVTGFEGDEVLVDFNHPLAGRTIVFEVRILDAAPAEVH